MSAPTIELVAGFQSDDGTGYAFCDVNHFDDGSVFAPDLIEHDITNYGRDVGFTVTRGVQSIFTQGFTANAGVFSGVLSNRDRRFDPNYLSGPYVVGGTGSKVVPGVPIILRTTHNAVDYTLFTGTADEWPQTYPEVAVDQVVQLNATDATGFFAGTDLQLTRPAEYSGTRIQAIVNALGWKGPTAISRGTTIVSALTRGTVSAWSHMTDVTNAEWGDLYIAKDGTFTFRGRDLIFSETRSTTSQATFGDNGSTELACKTEMGQAPIINRVVITWNDTGSQVVAEDLLSQQQSWKIRTLPLSLPFNDPSTAQLYAQWIVSQFAYPRTVFTTVEIAPSRGNAVTSGINNLLPQAFGREVGDRITAKKTMSVGPRLSSECFIRGISHTYADHVWSSTKFFLQDASLLSNIAHFDVSSFDDGSVLGF